MRYLYVCTLSQSTGIPRTFRDLDPAQLADRRRGDANCALLTEEVCQKYALLSMLRNSPLLRNWVGSGRAVTELGRFLRGRFRRRLLRESGRPLKNPGSDRLNTIPTTNGAARKYGKDGWESKDRIACQTSHAMPHKTRTTNRTMYAIATTSEASMPPA